MATMIEIDEHSSLITGQNEGLYSGSASLSGPMIEPCLEEDGLIFGQQIGLYSGGIVSAGPQIEFEEWLNVVIGTTTLPLEDFDITPNGICDEIFTGATYPKLGDTMRLADYIEDPKPVADFTTNRVDGIAPFSVQFQDTSTDAPVIAWRWNFGDGSTSMQQNPVHVFPTPGKYTISLRVYSYTQQDTIVRNEYIRAGTLDFVSDKLSGPVKLKCRFNAEIVLP